VWSVYFGDFPVCAPVESRKTGVFGVEYHAKQAFPGCKMTRNNRFRGGMSRETSGFGVEYHVKHAFPGGQYHVKRASSGGKIT
jgi:hypothetical protein